MTDQHALPFVGWAARPEDIEDAITVRDSDELDALDSDLESCGVLAKGAGTGGGMNADFLRWLLNPADIRPLREAMEGCAAVCIAPRRQDTTP